MLTTLETFFARLREAGVPISVHEALDAARAAGAVDATGRDVLRAALAATIVKDDAHRTAFDAVFDVTFAARSVPAEGEEEGEPPSALAERLRGELEEAVRRGDLEAVEELARRAARVFAGVGDRQSGPGYFSYRAAQALGADEVWRRLLGGIGAGAPLERALEEAGIAVAQAAFDDALRREVLRLLVQDRGPETVNRWVARPLPENVEFVTATRDEREALTKAVRPLARRLATRLARRKRHGPHGRLDVRRTVRASMSTGGVPFDPRFRRRHPHRPDLFVLCDVSGSVAAFSRFTLQFVHALQSQFRAVRSFVFVDTLDEVTEDFRGGEFAPSLAAMVQRARVVWGDGHSDYGSSLKRFERLAGDALTKRSVVLVLGDARNNYRDPGDAAVARIAERARRVWWLNPEPRRWWDTGDSVAARYVPHLTGMHECRNLRQLEAFVERVV
ncbi:MAG TPA: VWA domain-containing protein [Actinomycetota bacterium]|nr:VWA domain-containing protein [Actinomycetota bacterium]